MSNARSALTVVGEVVGAYLTDGSSYGAAIGGFIGGQIGGAIDGPMRNTQDQLQDLTALKFDYGSTWPRIYGRYRFKVSPMWSSTKRPIAHEEEVDSKGGPSAVNTTFTYSQDWMCWAPINAIGFARVWENGVLTYTRLADGSIASLDASAATTAWSEITFLDGNAAQLPWPVYEAAVGADNAVAGRFRPMLAFGSLDLGGSGSPPLIEAEFYSSGTESAADANVRLQANFNDGDGTDISAFNQSYTLFGEAGFADVLPPGESGIFDNGITNVLGKIKWTGAGLDKTDVDYTAQFRVETLYDDTSFEQVDVFKYYYGAAGGQYVLVSVGNSIFFGRILTVRDANVIGTYYTVIPADGAHIGMEIVNNVTDGEVLKLYVNGVLSITMPHANLPTSGGDHAYLEIGEYPNSGAVAHSIRVDNVRIKLGLEATSGGFTGSPSLPPPDVFGTRITLGTVLLSDIVLSEALLLWTGEDGALTADDIDVTGLAGIEVTGFATTGSPREAIAQLADMYYFGCVCSDKLYFRLRGAAPIDTVAFDQTGMGVGEPGIPFTGVERANDLEVAIQVAVTGPNQLADYDPGTEQSDRLVGESVQLVQYTTPVVFTPAERKGRAETMVLDGRVASNTAKVILDDRHVEKEPFDVWIQVDDQGNSYRIRSIGESYADGIHDHDVVLDDATVLSSSGITTETDARAVTVAAVPTTTVVPLDIPDLDGSDIGRGLYVAAKPSTATGWGGYSFDESDDALTGYSKLGSGTKATVIGVCSVVPGAWSRGRVFNEVDSIVVDVGDGVLSSATRTQIIADETANAFAIGAHGRWLLGQFCTATLTAPGIYTLTGLLTGSKGTEQYIGTQVVGDQFVLLKTTGGVIRVPQRAIDQGALRYYKAVSVGKSIDGTVGSSITQQEVGLMPLSPFRVRVARDTSGNATITWQRRTRLATRISGPAGILIPLGEESESYSIEICTTGSFATVAQTLSSSTESVTYSAAAQTTDLGAPANPLYVRVRQRSAVVGLGFAAQKAA